MLANYATMTAIKVGIHSWVFVNRAPTIDAFSIAIKVTKVCQLLWLLLCSSARDKPIAAFTMSVQLLDSFD